MNIVLIGIQGSGKGTLSAKLKDYFDFDLISVGELLRAEAKRKTKLGKHIFEMQSKGILLEQDIVMQVIKNKLKSKKTQNVIFDGFPRTIEQADALDEVLKIDLVIYLHLSKEEATKRLLSRVGCNDCGSIFNKNEVKSTCPLCGGKLVKRSDDNLISIKNRLKQFHLQTHPVVDRYKAANTLVTIDASQTKEAVLKDVVRAINEHNN